MVASTSCTPDTSPAWKAPSGSAISWSSASTPTLRSKASRGSPAPSSARTNRASLLAGLACVDVVIVFDEETPVSLIELLEPDVLVKGGDYTLDQIAGGDVVLARGGQVVALPLVAGLSTTAILDRNARG